MKDVTLPCGCVVGVSRCPESQRIIDRYQAAQSSSHYTYAAVTDLESRWCQHYRDGWAEYTRLKRLASNPVSA